MLYQTFRVFPDNSLAKFGRATTLPKAIARAQAFKGAEVRPVGSLQVVWIQQTFTPLYAETPPKPAPKRFQRYTPPKAEPAPQSSTRRYHKPV